MRIEKTIKGEKFPFQVKFIPLEMKATVRFLTSYDEVIGTITDDFKKIILPDDYLSPYISSVGNIPVKYLKLNRSLSDEAKYYNGRK